MVLLVESQFASPDVGPIYKDGSITLKLKLPAQAPAFLDIGPTIASALWPEQQVNDGEVTMATKFDCTGRMSVSYMLDTWENGVKSENVTNILYPLHEPSVEGTGEIRTKISTTRSEDGWIRYSLEYTLSSKADCDGATITFSSLPIDDNHIVRAYKGVGDGTRLASGSKTCLWGYFVNSRQIAETIEEQAKCSESAVVMSVSVREY